MPMLRNTLLIIQAIKTDKGWDLISVPENVWFYCPPDFYGLRAVTSPRVLLVLCIIAQWQLGSSYDFLQGQV